VILISDYLSSSVPTPAQRESTQCKHSSPYKTGENTFFFYNSCTETQKSLVILPAVNCCKLLKAFPLHTEAQYTFMTLKASSGVFARQLQEMGWKRLQHPTSLLPEIQHQQAHTAPLTLCCVMNVHLQGIANSHIIIIHLHCTPHSREVCAQSTMHPSICP
jgi:hypothetical protein